MAEIIPAIMPKTLNDLKDHVERVAEAVKVVQMDIMDGSFVQNKTWPYIRPDDYFESIARGEEGLPFWEKVDYEIDLMIKNPLEVVDSWVQAGARRIIFHVESLPSFETGDISADVTTILSYANDFTEVGLAIALETPVEIIKPFLEQVSCVQFMGIKRIGFQGEPLDERVIGKIQEVRKHHPHLPLSVDGGVSEYNIHELAEAGANRFVSGSGIFEEVNPIEAIRNLKQLAHI